MSICKCGHPKIDHSLYEGVQGEGMCLAYCCECEGFEAPVPAKRNDARFAPHEFVPNPNHPLVCDKCGREEHNRKYHTAVGR